MRAESVLTIEHLRRRKERLPIQGRNYYAIHPALLCTALGITRQQLEERDDVKIGMMPGSTNIEVALYGDVSDVHV